MDSRRIFLALLVLTASIPGTAFAGSLPTPVTRTTFDISRKGNAASIDFRVKGARSYYIALEFAYRGHDDQQRVLDLVKGNGSPQNQGVDVAIQLSVLRLQSNGRTLKPLFDENVVTKTAYAQSFTYEKFVGQFKRKIVTIDLTPGDYRVEARTLDDNPAFSGTPSFLLIDYHSRLRFLPNSIVPKND